MPDLSFILTLLFLSGASGSALQESCSRDENCGIFDTYCKNGTCECKDNFIEFIDTCVYVAAPDVKCSRKQDCTGILGGRSSCKKGRCICNQFHHFYNGQCVKTRGYMPHDEEGMFEECEFDYQCYCGENCQKNIECSSRMCACKTGTKQYKRRCLSITSNSFKHTFSTFLILLCFFLKIL